MAPIVIGFSMLGLSVPLWLLHIRPYARTHGAGYTTGANFGVGAWVDCDQAREAAQREGDKAMLAACRVFMLLAGGGPVVVIAGLLL